MQKHQGQHKGNHIDRLSITSLENFGFSFLRFEKKCDFHFFLNQILQQAFVFAIKEEINHLRGKVK